MVQRGHHRERSRDPADPVGETERRQRRRPVFDAGLMGESAHRFGQRAECSSLGVGPGLTEAGDTQNDQAGVFGLEPFRTQTPFLEHAGAEILDQHVRRAREGPQHLLALRPTKIEGDASLVAGDHLPPQSVSVLVRAVRSRRVAARVLDLDDVRPEVAEHHRGDGGGVDGADVQDTDALKRARNRVLRIWIVVH